MRSQVRSYDEPAAILISKRVLHRSINGPRSHCMARCRVGYRAVTLFMSVYLPRLGPCGVSRMAHFLFYDPLCAIRSVKETAVVMGVERYHQVQPMRKPAGGQQNDRIRRSAVAVRVVNRKPIYI